MNLPQCFRLALLAALLASVQFATAAERVVDRSALHRLTGCEFGGVSCVRD